ncbi:MAG TPA: proton-conducting transporter membrane subunit [bacterium]|jgi:hydrogenase-4 component F
MVLLLLILIPLAAALATLLAGKATRTFEAIAAVAALGEAALVAVITAQVGREGRCGFDSLLAVDALGTIVLLTVAVVGVAAAFYSMGYLREEVRKQIIGLRRVKQYFVLFHLFLMAMFFAVSTVNPIMMWIAIEATTLSTAFLISFYSKSSSMEAAWKYLIINSIGLLLGFFGTLLFMTATRDLPADLLVNWQVLLANASRLDPLVAKIAFIFALIGYGTKAGLVPMHTWLPDAYSKAPSPISALSSGALMNVAVLAILRFKMVTDKAIDPHFSQNLMIFFGVVSVVVAAFIMFPQRNYKRLFAYSSIEHVGILALGFGFGGLGAFAALLHMIYHSLSKSILFYSAGNVLIKFGSTKIANIKGLLPALPLTGLILILGFLSITGTPPFGMFLTEVYILTAGMAAHPAVVVTVIAMLALVFIGFLRHIVAMTFSKSAEPLPAGEANLMTTLPPVILLSTLIIIGVVVPEPLKALLESAASFIR